MVGLIKLFIISLHLSDIVNVDFFFTIILVTLSISYNLGINHTSITAFSKGKNIIPNLSSSSKDPAPLTIFRDVYIVAAM